MASSVFQDGHRDLRNRLAVVVEHERRLVKVKPKSPQPALIIAGREDRKVHRSR